MKIRTIWIHFVLTISSLSFAMEIHQSQERQAEIRLQKKQVLQIEVEMRQFEDKIEEIRFIRHKLMSMEQSLQDISNCRLAMRFTIKEHQKSEVECSAYEFKVRRYFRDLVRVGIPDLSDDSQDEAMLGRPHLRPWGYESPYQAKDKLLADQPEKDQIAKDRVARYAVYLLKNMANEGSRVSQESILKMYREQIARHPEQTWMQDEMEELEKPKNTFNALTDRAQIIRTQIEAMVSLGKRESEFISKQILLKKSKANLRESIRELIQEERFAQALIEEERLAREQK